MSILNDADIRKLLESGDLKIDNFDEANLDGASYDLRLGSLYYISNEKEPRKLEEGQVLCLEPNQFALVTTHEIIELPSNIVGQVGLRSRFSLSGLVNISGIQIDPGFKGRLVLGIVNLSNKSRKISYLERMFSIHFQELTNGSTKVYKGFLRNVNSIPTDLIERLENSDTPTLQELSTKVEKLENLIRWVIIGGFGFIIAIILQIIFGV